MLKLVSKKLTLQYVLIVCTKYIKRLLRGKLQEIKNSAWFQQTLNNFVNLDFFFTKLSGIDPCEKRIIILLGGHTWRHLFIACDELVAMAIYVVKQACGNDILSCVYTELKIRILVLQQYILQIVCQSLQTVDSCSFHEFFRRRVFISSPFTIAQKRGKIQNRKNIPEG